MKTGRDFGLPAEYNDWEEVSFPVASTPQRPQHGRFIEVSWGEGDATPTGTGVVWKPGNKRILVPPKTKLPDVNPGAVISFRCQAGSVRRAIRSGWGTWRVFERGTPVVYYGTEFTDPIATDRELLNDVNTDGFTVELGGL